VVDWESNPGKPMLYRHCDDWCEGRESELCADGYVLVAIEIVRTFIAFMELGIKQFCQPFAISGANLGRMC
jgi:hypothetical protein